MSRIQGVWTVTFLLIASVVVVCQPDTGANSAEPLQGDGLVACSEEGMIDSDRDGIPDRDEGMDEVDTDNDGQPDARDTDSDDDGRPDSEEAGIMECGDEPIDSDNDGIPNYKDTDSDNNGLNDGADTNDDLDGDGIPNWMDPDDDGDGLDDAIEIGADPLDPPDCDTDGVPDFHDLDSDGDSIPDSLEGNDDIDGDGLGSAFDTDSDADGISDADESRVNAGQNPIDSDGDGHPDYKDTDSDNDGLADWEEIDAGTLPIERDTDGDLYADAREIECGTDPLDGTNYPVEGPCVNDGCGPAELCGDDNTGDGLDNDCNGHVDETCTCPEPGATQACYPDYPANRGNGICVDGIQSCTEFLHWSECEGGSGPEIEICDDGIDQDCDGEDEPCCLPYPDCFCIPGAVRFCDTPTYCNWGTQYCNDAGTAWGPCVEMDTPPQECEAYSTMYNSSAEQCCIDQGWCCQDFWDIDGDGDNDESLGNCEDIVCPRCNCDPDSIRYCSSSWSDDWGIQICQLDSQGWDWSTCEPSDPPETCSNHSTYDDGGQECCMESGYCCRDDNDLNNDWDDNESMGNCREAECCINLDFSDPEERDIDDE